MHARARKKHLAEVRAYVARLQPLLRLAHWECEVADDEPATPGAVASCDPNTRIHRATLRFSDRHFADPPEEQRDTVVHELLHCTTDGMWLALEAFKEATSDVSYAHLSDRYVHELECAVNQLTKLIAPSLPLPTEAP